VTEARKRIKVSKPRPDDRAQATRFAPVARNETKQRLLAGTLDYLREYGVADVTLRQLAQQLGTSHRLLSYHFGTKEGLLVAVVQEIEREQQAWLESLWERDMTPMELIRMSWERTCDPQLDRQLRLFVEIYGHAVQRRPHTEQLLDTLVDAWLKPVGHLFRRMGMTAAMARIHARLYVATMRGLMLDLLTTGDAKAITAAWEHYVSQYDKLPGAHRVQNARLNGNSIRD
jgi:AcrR family transcriptional regulator